MGNKAKAKFKFNSGNGALLCSTCSAIIKVGYEFTEDEWKALRGEIHMDPQYCDKCEEKFIYNDSKTAPRKSDKKHRRGKESGTSLDY